VLTNFEKVMDDDIHKFLGLCNGGFGSERRGRYNGKGRQ
jgi:hypothetical protein